jgi:hypothetical protein
MTRSTEGTGTKRAIWRQPGNTAHNVKILERLPATRSGPPAAIVFDEATKRMEAAPLSELYERDDPAAPYR